MSGLVMRHAAALAVVLSVAAAPAFAAGGSGGGDSGSQNCAAGQVYDKKQQKCVPKSSSLDTETLFEAGRSLAYAGRYDEAISVLTLAEDRNDPGVFNMLGYSNRKQGKLLVALGYYEEALRIDPNHVLTREYLGEAHLQMGDVASAREQLREIEKRAGSASEEYVALAGHIETYEKKQG